VYASLTEEQAQFQDVVTRFLAENADAARLRRQIDSEAGFDREVWQRLCRELGLPGTHIPEQYGGHGFGAVEFGIVMHALGRFLYSGPFMASAVMSAYAILNAGSEGQKSELLQKIASGSVIAALALDDWAHPDGVGKQVHADRQAGGHALSGSATTLLGAGVPQLLIVPARTGGSAPSLFAVDARSPGIEAVPRDTIDLTRRAARITFNAAPAELLGAEGGANIDRLWDQLCVSLALEMIGGAEQLFYSTIDYMKLRVQFGRVIGSFQALKHRCADLLVDLELARAASQHALQCVTRQGGDVYAPNMAKAMASEVYMKIAREAIQLRGGIGFTWEEDTHLWFRRAKSSEVLLGSPHWHRERMMQRIEEAASGA